MHKDHPVDAPRPGGCDLLNSGELLLGPSLPVAGQHVVNIPLANNPAIAGSVLHVQVAELQFGGGGAWVGLFTSNGITITVGAL